MISPNEYPFTDETVDKIARDLEDFPQGAMFLEISNGRQHLSADLLEVCCTCYDDRKETCPVRGKVRVDLDEQLAVICNLDAPVDTKPAREIGRWITWVALAICGLAILAFILFGLIF